MIRILSIRRRLLILLLGVICSLWGIVTWLVYVETQHEVEELFDANLAQSARVLFGLIKHEMEEYEEEDEKDEEEEWIELEEHLSGHKYEHKLGFIIRAKDGHILISSTATPLFPLPSHNFAKFSDHWLDGYLWRVFTLKTGQFIVQTGERYDIREELNNEIISSTLSILLIALPLLALLIWISVGRSLKPLQLVATEIATRSPEQLQALDIKKIPLEIKCLVNALNNLFIRLEQAFENERRFTADAAHELRTPLAGLKTQAQVAQRATTPQQRQQALQQILLGADRATHLVTQLLTLARLDATQTMPTCGVDMHKLLSQLIVDFTEQALDKSIDLGLENTATYYVTQGNQDALYFMFRNLVDNAIRYTARKGQITVSLENLQLSQLSVTIRDTGPGIASDEQKTRIFERFYRGENQNIQGSGLGLSIVQRVAQLHQVEIQLDDGQNGSGLSVRVDFWVVPTNQCRT